MFAVSKMLVLWCALSITIASSVGDLTEHPETGSEESVINTEDKTKDWPFGTKNIKFTDQSPVDIDENSAVHMKLEKLRFSDFGLFENAKVNVTNTGTTVRISLTDDDAAEKPSITGGPLLDSIYTFEHMHFHWGVDEKGSEHEINGKKFAMELHMVYYKNEYKSLAKAIKSLKGVCVIGVLLEISTTDNSDLNNFMEVLKHIVQVDGNVKRNFKDEFNWIKHIFNRTSESYHTYHGSLTTPPFSGSVNWIISPKTIKISSKQLEEFRNLHSKKHTFILANHRKLFKLEKRKLFKVVN